MSNEEDAAFQSMGDPEDLKFAAKFAGSSFIYAVWRTPEEIVQKWICSQYCELICCFPCLPCSLYYHRKRIRELRNQIHIISQDHIIIANGAKETFRLATKDIDQVSYQSEALLCCWKGNLNTVSVTFGEKAVNLLVENHVEISNLIDALRQRAIARNLKPLPRLTLPTNTK